MINVRDIIFLTAGALIGGIGTYLYMSREQYTELEREEPETENPEIEEGKDINTDDRYKPSGVMNNMYDIRPGEIYSDEIQSDIISDEILRSRAETIRREVDWAVSKNKIIDPDMPLDLSEYSYDRIIATLRHRVRVIPPGPAVSLEWSTIQLDNYFHPVHLEPDLAMSTNELKAAILAIGEEAHPDKLSDEYRYYEFLVHLIDHPIDEHEIITDEDYGYYESYDTGTLIYFGDDMLTTDDFTYIDDYYFTVGDALEQFEEDNFDQVVHVRNHISKTDYEIVRDNRMSTDARSELPPNYYD